MTGFSATDWNTPEYPSSNVFLKREIPPMTNEDFNNRCLSMLYLSVVSPYLRFSVPWPDLHLLKHPVIRSFLALNRNMISLTSNLKTLLFCW